MATQKPNALKKEPVIPNHDEAIFDSAFSIPQSVKDEIKALKLATRWINSTQFQKGFGFHKNRWQPFKSQSLRASVGDVFGGDPEGYVRRGDLILAVKPKELQDKHKAYNSNRIADSMGVKEKQKTALKELAREHGVKTTIETDDEDSE